MSIYGVVMTIIYAVSTRSKSYLGIIYAPQSDKNERTERGKRGQEIRANALENAFAYVRFTRYDVRFIHNVRVAQIFSDH